MSTTPEFRTTTTAQDAFAEALAGRFDSVAVRLLHDGVASVIGYTEGEIKSVCLIDEDGEPLSTGAETARRDAEGQRIMDSLAWQPGAGMSHDEVRAMFAEAMRAWPQYDGKLDDARVGVALRHFATKGGIAQEPGDVVLILPTPTTQITGHVTVLGARRLGYVSTPRGDVRAIAEV